MSTESYNDAMAKSIEFINGNHSATSDDLPPYFFKYWTDGSILKDTYPGPLIPGLPLAVFLYAYMAHKTLKTRNREVIIDPEEIKHKYFHWQMMLNVCTINKVEGYKLRPIKIFDFENIENIKYSVKVPKRKKVF